jgi:hypothetical protein
MANQDNTRPEGLLHEIDRFVQGSNLDRSTYLREVLRKGFSLGKQDRLLLKYVRKELSQMEVCKELNWDPWEFLSQMLPYSSALVKPGETHLRHC